MYVRPHNNCGGILVVLCVNRLAWLAYFLWIAAVAVSLLFAGDATKNTAASEASYS